MSVTAASATFSITINAGVSINAITLPAGYPGTAFTPTTVTATGGTRPSSVFFPATLSVTVTNNSTTSENFIAALDYTVSGTVSYTGSKTEQTYLTLVGGNSSGNGAPGASISGTGAFTIRGVAPGSYNLQALMDSLGNGSPNASDPNGNTPNVTVSNANDLSQLRNSPIRLLAQYQQRSAQRRRCLQPEGHLQRWDLGDADPHGERRVGRLPTNLSPISGASTTPTFTWTDPTNASSYIYSFYISGNGNTIWQIPGNNSNVHTLIFVIEDDAQDGVDHVDSPRNQDFAFTQLSNATAVLLPVEGIVATIPG